MQLDMGLFIEIGVNILHRITEQLICIAVGGTNYIRFLSLTCTYSKISPENCTFRMYQTGL